MTGVAGGGRDAGRVEGRGPVRVRGRGLQAQVVKLGGIFIRPIFLASKHWLRVTVAKRLHVRVLHVE